MIQKLADVIALVDDFYSLSPREKIKLIAWHLHANAGAEAFGNAEVRASFREINEDPPDVSVYLPRMVDQGDLLKFGKSYKLTGAIRRTLDAKYGAHPTVVAVSKLLSDLPAKVPNLEERAFLSEALNCYRVGAYRAAIVMAWNLAFDHLLGWIFNEPARLAAFNAAIPSRYPKSKLQITTRENFEDAKELEIVEVAYSANILSKNVVDILRNNLRRRNRAAHPSKVVIVQSQADDAITDLVNNIILSLEG